MYVWSTVLYKFSPTMFRLVIPYSFSVGRLLASGRSPFFYPCIFPVCARARGIGKNSSNLSHNVRPRSPRWFPVFAKDSKIGYSFSVYFRPVYTDRGDQRMEKKAIRNIACPSISGRMVTDVWWRIYFICQTLGHRWTENSGNVNRNILKQCLHGNN